jgi:hypothetical protein
MAMPGSPEFADIAFVVDEGALHAVACGARVPVARRSNLKLPERMP